MYVENKIAGVPILFLINGWKIFIKNMRLILDIDAF